MLTDIQMVIWVFHPMTELWHRYLGVLILLMNSLDLTSTSFCETRCAENFVGSMDSFQVFFCEIFWTRTKTWECLLTFIKSQCYSYRTQDWIKSFIHPCETTRDMMAREKHCSLSRCGTSPGPVSVSRNLNWIFCCRWTMVKLPLTELFEGFFTFKMGFCGFLWLFVCL